MTRSYSRFARSAHHRMGVYCEESECAEMVMLPIHLRRDMPVFYVFVSIKRL